MEFVPLIGTIIIIAIAVVHQFDVFESSIKVYGVNLLPKNSVISMRFILDTELYCFKRTTYQRQELSFWEDVFVAHELGKTTMWRVSGGPVLKHWTPTIWKECPYYRYERVAASDHPLVRPARTLSCRICESGKAHS